MTPTDVSNMCLPDIVLLYSSYIDEAQQMEDLSKEIENNTSKD